MLRNMAATFALPPVPFSQLWKCLKPNKSNNSASCSDSAFDSDSDSEYAMDCVHSSVQLGENKWFNKRLEVCNHLNFTSFVLFMISVRNFNSTPPPHISPSALHSLSPNYRTKQNYFDLYARRQSPQSAPAEFVVFLLVLSMLLDCQ